MPTLFIPNNKIRFGYWKIIQQQMSTNGIPEAELIDLPQEDERPKVKICSPKLVIVSMLAAYFLFQNVYHFITNPLPQLDEKDIPKVDSWQQFWGLWDRFQAYVIITVVAFILFYFLRQSNDKIEQERYLLQKQKEQQAEEKERKLQSEREERIIKKLEEEERLASQKQYQAAQAYAQSAKAKED